MSLPTTLTVASLAMLASVPALQTPPPASPPPAVAEVKEEKVTEEEPKSITCIGCNKNEETTLTFFYDRGITDRNALATLMGNIKQESRFVSNICEGGFRVAYSRCHSGGFGIAQWTTTNRYLGLGRHARRIGQAPELLDTQLSYLVTERQWKRVEPHFKAPGKTIPQYMNSAYTWLGWGVHGNRTRYSYDYSKRIIIA